MGGRGSGDWQEGRPLTCDRVRLDLRALRRAGLTLAARAPAAGGLEGADDARRVRVGWLTVVPVYPAADAPHAADAAGPPGAASAVDVTAADDAARVALAWHRTGYGWRPLWRCPRCAAAAAVLYGRGSPWSPWGWRCRRCAGLAYASTRMRPDERADARLRRAAAALGMPPPGDGWSFAMLPAAGPPRPPGMRRAAYRRRLEVYRAAHAAAGDAWLAALLRFGRRYAAPSRADAAPRGPTPPGSAAARRAFADALERGRVGPPPPTTTGAAAVRAAFAVALERGTGGEGPAASTEVGASDSLTISAKHAAADAGEGAGDGRLP